jgi:hypothetical protein
MRRLSFPLLRKHSCHLGVGLRHLLGLPHKLQYKVIDVRGLPRRQDAALSRLRVARARRDAAEKTYHCLLLHALQDAFVLGDSQLARVDAVCLVDFDHEGLECSGVVGQNPFKGYLGQVVVQVLDLSDLHDLGQNFEEFVVGPGFPQGKSSHALDCQQLPDPFLRVQALETSFSYRC